MRIENVNGGCSGGIEGGEVVTKKVQVGFHGLVKQMAEIRQLFYVFDLDGALERGSEV